MSAKETETPRTDTVAFDPHLAIRCDEKLPSVVEADFARTLERALAAANEQIKDQGTSILDQIEINTEMQNRALDAEKRLDSLAASLRATGAVEVLLDSRKHGQQDSWPSIDTDILRSWTMLTTLLAKLENKAP